MQTHRKHTANAPRTRLLQHTATLAHVSLQKNMQKKRIAGIFAKEIKYFEDVLCYSLFLLKNNFPSL